MSVHKNGGIGKMPEEKNIPNGGLDEAVKILADGIIRLKKKGKLK
jgi:hypothetical protein